MVCIIISPMFVLVALIVFSIPGTSTVKSPDQPANVSGETIILWSILVSSLAVVLSFIIVRSIKYCKTKYFVKQTKITQSIGYSSEELQTLEREMNYEEIASN